ncbi:MAG: biopolymer transporter ExbD [Gammaproteobacteria bacterium]|nr:biopolymer transporter ExbD [Gammaproteobacteria bacterium]
MKIRYFETRKGRIELIPMIDVMFFLLVFFMILTLRMIPDEGMHMALPQSTTAKTLPRPKILIDVAHNGALRLRGVAVSHAVLEADLTAAAARKPEVTIAAAKNVPFQDFVQIMDICRKAGITGVGIATEPQG